MQIGLISDTHGWISPKLLPHLKGVDEIWHAGDIGDPDVLDPLLDIAPVRAVYGNIDGSNIRSQASRDQIFEHQGLRFFMTHIATRGQKIIPEVRQRCRYHRAHVLIHGHSHMLRVIRIDELLVMNPGAAGRHGFHQRITALRLDIIEGKIENVRAIDVGPRTDR